MPTKQKIKCTVDLGMTVLLPLLMAYSLVGEAAHEWLGMAMLALFILHHALNFKWLKNVRNGRYSGFRILQTMLAALILLTMLGSMVSGILMSRHVFGTVRFRAGDWTQSVHLFCAYWGFVLMSLHLGLHWTMILGMLRRLYKTVHSPRRTLILRCIFGVISGFGIVFFVRNRLTDYLFLRTHFVMLDWDVTLTSFLIQYLCMMGLFVCAGCYLGKAVQKMQRSVVV